MDTVFIDDGFVSVPTRFLDRIPMPDVVRALIWVPASLAVIAGVVVGSLLL